MTLKDKQTLTLNDVLDELMTMMEKGREVQNVPYEADYYSYINGIDKCLETIREYKTIIKYRTSVAPTELRISGKKLEDAPEHTKEMER